MERTGKSADGSEKRYRTPFEGSRLDLLGARFEVLAIGAPGGEAVKPHRLVDEIVRPVLRVGMPRAPRLIAPDTLHHVISSGLERGDIAADGQDRESVLAQLGLPPPTRHGSSGCPCRALRKRSRGQRMNNSTSSVRSPSSRV